QMNASEQDSINVKQRFDAARSLFVKEIPLRFGESEVVMAVVSSDAVFRNGLQLAVLWRRVQNERREKLFHHITVFLEQQSEELLHIVGDQVDLQGIAQGRNFYRLAPRIETYDLMRRQDVNAAQVVIGVGRRKAVKMRAADCGKQKRVRLPGDFAVYSRIKLHINSLIVLLWQIQDERIGVGIWQTALIRYYGKRDETGLFARKFSGSPFNSEWLSPSTTNETRSEWRGILQII